MSRCSCEKSRHFRVTGEVIDAPATTHPDTLGSGAKQVRVRCGECGGKVRYIGSDFLNVLGITDDEIQAGMGLPDGERVHLEVDLI